MTRHLVAIGALVALLAACGEAAPVATPQPTPPPRPIHACTAASIAEPGFVADTPHAGTLTAGRYSLNGDVQGALLTFAFQTGERGVFTSVPTRPLPTNPADQTPGAAPTPTPTATPAAALTTAPPGAGPDLLVLCDVLRFTQPDGGKKFVTAFRQLRLDSGQQQVTAPPLGDRSVAFMDRDQAFGGYTIDNANGAEIGVGRGDTFWSVSVFGPHPSLDTALAILRSMIAGAG